MDEIAVRSGVTPEGDGSGDPRTVAEYLAQAEVFWSPKTGQFEPISEMNHARRMACATWLRSRSTAFLIRLENAADAAGELPHALRLMDIDPRSWIQETPLYEALYWDERPAIPRQRPSDDALAAMRKLGDRRP